MVEVVVNQNDGFVSITAVGGETDLDGDFPIYEKSHVTIKRTRSGTTTTLVLNTDYTIADNQLELTAGFTAVLAGTATPAVAGDVYTLLLNVPEERTTDFNQAGDFRASTINREFDLQTQQIQGLRRDVDKSARLPDTSTLTSLELPTPTASYIIGWNATADGLANYAATDLSGTVVSAFATTLLDDTTAAQARTTLGALASDISTLTAETAVATDDLVPLYDTSGATTDKMTVENFFKAVNAFTEDTAPAGATDFALTYDTSASTVKKVKPTNLLKSINDLSTVAVDSAADYVPFFDTSGGVAAKTLASAIISQYAPVLLSEQTVSNAASLNFTGFMSSTYRLYFFYLYDVYGASAAALWARYGQAASYLSTATYNSSIVGRDSAGNPETADNAGGTKIIMSGASLQATSTQGGAWCGFILNPAHSAETRTLWLGSYKSDSLSRYNSHIGSGMNTATTAITDVQFLMASGNIYATGLLFGIK